MRVSLSEGWYPRSTMVDPGHERMRSYLIVTMAGTRYAIPARRVLGVLRRVSVNTFPAQEPAFLGLTTYANDAVAVLDGAMAFGLRDMPGAPTTEPVVVMVGAGGGEAPEPVGLLVEDAERMVTLTGEEADGSPEGTTVCDPGGLRSDDVGREP